MSQTEVMPLIAVSQMSFSYRHSGSRGLTTLEDINFDVARGETMGVVGRNGAGKSTLLRLLAGVLKPASGSIDYAPGVRCGLLSLGLGFMPELTGADNAVVSLMLQGNTEREARVKVRKIREFSELGDGFYQRVKTYSAGMRSRLTFSIALLTDSEILLIDEVLAVGDAQFREKARAAMLDRISGEQTIIYVSHVESTVREICDRVLWLEKGKLRALGATKDVLAEYSSSR